MTRVLFIASAVCALTASAAAQEKLEIRPGMWEITATTKVTGMPVSRELLERLTPEQRAQVEAEMKAQAATGPQTAVTRECITEEDVERPFKPANTADCRQTIVRTTRTTQEARLECTGEQKGTGLLRVEAENPETMTAQLDMRAGEGAEAFAIEAEMKGRWLGPACEDEDPIEEDEEDLASPDEYDEPEDDG